MRYAFAKSVLEQLLKEDVIRRDASILAVCAGEAEKEIFSSLHFINVTLSGLYEGGLEGTLALFTWRVQDAQNLTFEGETFDFCFVSDGIHHCASPHRAILEMYRVCREGILVFDSRDSFLMRLANALDLSPIYELEAVVFNDFERGGVNDSHIPNHIYRMTEREFKKTIRSYHPIGEHHFRFFYGLNLPYEQAALRKSHWKWFAVRLADPFVKLFTRVFKRQCNSFAMIALKPRVPNDLWPWLELKDGVIAFKRNYARKKFTV